MAKDDILYKSIFLIILGFLIFVLITFNKTNGLFPFLASYFVIFLISGILISSTGIIFYFVWDFKNRKPYFEQTGRTKTHFASFLSYGVILTFLSLYARYYFKGISSGFNLMLLAVSTGGILLMLIGLRFFIKEVIIARRAPLHS